MTDKLEDTSLRLKDEMDLYKKMMDKLRQNRNEFQRERDTMQEVRPCAKVSSGQKCTVNFRRGSKTVKLFSKLSKAKVVYLCVNCFKM